MSRKMNHSRSGRSAFWMLEFMAEEPIKMRIGTPVMCVRDNIDTTDALPCDKRTLSSWLWQNSKTQQIAAETLNTEFIQGIKNGNLHPDNYGGYMVQDAVYCESAADNYKDVASNASGEIRKFMDARYQSFVKYYKAMFEDWHIQNSSAIALSKVATNYIRFEKNVADTMDPLYLITAMIPCLRLWSWMAEQLKPFATDNNVYNFWITENSDDHGAIRLEQFLDKYSRELNREKCLEIYQQAMQSEMSFFKSATQ